MTNGVFCVISGVASCWRLGTKGVWGRYYSTSNNSQTVQDSYSYSYNGGLIESHTWSIEPRHSQWLWRTPNPDFKVRPFFDAEYLQNGRRYGHSYYGIGNRTQAFKWYHFQWPSVTSVETVSTISATVNARSWRNCRCWRSIHYIYRIESKMALNVIICTMLSVAIPMRSSTIGLRLPLD